MARTESVWICKQTEATSTNKPTAVSHLTGRGCVSLNSELQEPRGLSMVAYACAKLAMNEASRDCWLISQDEWLSKQASEQASKQASNQVSEWVVSQ